eukprot:2513629-Pyramimonas_sp.AAC.1
MRPVLFDRRWASLLNRGRGGWHARVRGARQRLAPTLEDGQPYTRTHGTGLGPPGAASPAHWGHGPPNPVPSGPGGALDGTHVDGTHVYA